MSRFGGFLGGSGLPEPSNFNSAAPGIYSLDEAEAFRRLGYWPLIEKRDPYYVVTQFILSADGQLKDTSANAATLTTVGFTRQKVDGPVGKPISAAYNSAGSGYIRPADSANLTIGTNDYTLECWVWPTGQGNNDQPLFDTRNTSGQGGTFFGFRNSDGAIRADGNYSFGVGSVQMRRWNHVAFVRENGQLSVYVNGAKQGSSIVSTLNHTSSTLVVGGYSHSPLGVNPLVGYIADARVTIGTPRYSGVAPLVPTAAHPDTAQTDPYFANVSLGLHLDGADQSTTFTDFSPLNHTVTANGNAKLVTADKYFGTASGYFDGNGSTGLSIPYNAAFDFGTGDFTIEMWVKFNSIIDGRCLLSNGWSTLGTCGFLLYTVTNGVAFYSSTNTSNWDIASNQPVASNITTGVWYHIAVVREGDTFRTFKDGVQTTAFTNSGSLYAGTPLPLTVANSGTGGQPVNCYIDDLRITKGVARYPQPAFVPETDPAPIVQEPTPPFAPTLGDAFYGNQSVALNWRNAFNGGSDLTDFDIEYSTASDMSGGTIVNVPVGGAGPYGFSSPTTFTNPDNANTADVLIPGVLEITRTNQYAIYNSAVQSAWTGPLWQTGPQNPADTEWALGWSDECDVTTKTFGNFTDLWGGGGVGNNVVNAELVMRHVPTGRIWFIKFSSWTSMAGGGGFVYERREFYGCLNLPTAHTVTGLTNDTPYYLRVRANNAVGNGAYSSIVGPITPSSILPQRLIGGNPGLSTGPDPYEYDVSLLLHFDGADASTTFTDSSAANRTLTVGGNAQISTAQSAFSGPPAEGWDVSTAAFVQSFSVGVQASAPYGLGFSADGTRMYVVAADRLYAYTLGTAWDVSTATYDNFLDISLNTEGAQGITFKPDGTKMYLADTDGDTVLEYTLSTAWDTSSAAYTAEKAIGAQETGISGVAFDTTGTQMFIVGSAGDDVTAYTLSEAWSVTTATPTGTTFSVAAQETTPQDIFFKPDGTAMYIVGVATDTVYEYALSTAWDISTATLVNSFSVAAQETSPTAVVLKADGLQMYVIGYTSDSVNEYSLTPSGGGAPGSSGLFDGTDDYLSISSPPDALIRWFDTDYTLECWIYPTEFNDSGSSNNRPVLVGNTDLNAATDYWSFGPRGDGNLTFYYFNGGGQTVAGSSPLTLNQWQHIAFVHVSGTIKLFIDGVQVASAAVNGTPQANSNTIFNICGLGNDFNGYVDELRVTRGTARYVANFSVPTAAFPDPTVPPAYIGTAFKQDNYSEATALANKIFDNSLSNNTTNQWRTNTLSRAFGVDFGTTQEILRYRMWRNTGNEGTPTHWILQGSNTESDWTNLQNNEGQSTYGSWVNIDTRTGVNLPKVTGASPANQPYGEFVVANPDSYRYYRLFVSNVRADGPGTTTNRIFLAEMQFLAVITAPATPTGLAATPTSDGANLAWAYAGMRDDFDVEWADDAAFTNILGTTSTTTLVATITGLTIGTTYYARVRANNSAGTSAYTAGVSFTPAAGYSPNSDNIFRFRLDDQSTAAFAYIWTTTGYAKLVSSTGETSSVAGTGLSNYGNNYWRAYNIGPSITGLATGTERMISVISCDASGTPSGDIEFVDFSYAPPSGGVQRINLLDMSGCTALQGCLADSSTSGVGTGGMMAPPQPTSLPSTIVEVRAVGIGNALINSFTQTNYPQYMGGISYYHSAGLGVAGQQLSAAALNQLYTDLVTRTSGSGSILVHNNPGTAADDPTIATGKGYTVYGS